MRYRQTIYVPLGFGMHARRPKFINAVLMLRTGRRLGKPRMDRFLEITTPNLKSIALLVKRNDVALCFLYRSNKNKAIYPFPCMWGNICYLYKWIIWYFFLLVVIKDISKYSKRRLKEKCHGILYIIPVSLTSSIEELASFSSSSSAASALSSSASVQWLSMVLGSMRKLSSFQTPSTGLDWAPISELKHSFKRSILWAKGRYLPNYPTQSDMAQGRI